MLKINMAVSNTTAASRLTVLSPRLPSGHPDPGAAVSASVTIEAGIVHEPITSFNLSDDEGVEVYLAIWRRALAERPDHPKLSF